MSFQKSLPLGPGTIEKVTDRQDHTLQILLGVKLQTHLKDFSLERRVATKGVADRRVPRPCCPDRAVLANSSQVQLCRHVGFMVAVVPEIMAPYYSGSRPMPCSYYKAQHVRVVGLWRLAPSFQGKSRETRQVSLNRGPKELIRGLVMGKCKSQPATHS